MSVIVILLVPLVAALLVCIPLGKRWVPGVTVVSCLADLILIARLARQVVAGHAPGELLDAAWSKWIAVDGLSALILLLIALVATTAAIYSVGYMAHENLDAEKAAALSCELQPLHLLDARHSGVGGADAGLDRC